LQKATRSVPIVFAQVVDPVGSGFVETLARPGGNITGFSVFEYGISGKWLELLKEITPNVTRAAILRDVALAWKRAVGRPPIGGAVARSGIEADGRR
jgi:ABC transporter substrate binding protein